MTASGRCSAEATTLKERTLILHRADGSSDRDPFAALFDSHFAEIHRYLSRRVGPDGANELASEVFLIAFERRDRLDRAGDRARPWLFGIASNLLLHHWRSERRQLLAYARTGVDPIILDGMQAVDARVDAQGAGPAIAAALAHLASKDREVLLLLAWADLSYEEIARALDIPIGTVRSRLSRARRQVRERLGASGNPVEEGTRLGGDHDG